MALAGWMDSNLATQGYCLSPGETRRLRIGLRFPTALCLALVVTALALESAPLVFVLSGIGLVAGFAPRHPFDQLWNHGLRHLLGAPQLPPNPARRRHAFKVATAWLLGVGVLFSAGWDVAAVALGIALVGACSVVTIANFCIPSVALSLWERRRAREVMPA